MSEPTDTQSPTPPNRTRSARSPSTRGTKKTTQQTATSPRPAPDDREGWKKHWEAQGQPWRTEPEIDKERQKFLSERRAITPDIEKGIYPFKDIKLTRADIEWLLATHESEGSIGPVDWGDEKQHNRMGLDLRGADLSQVNLQMLPLASTRGGLSRGEWRERTLEQRIMAEIHLEGANLSSAHLERACLSRAHLQMANLYKANLAGADLYRAHLEGAYVTDTFLAGASLRNAFFETSTTLRDVTLTDTRVGPLLLVNVQWGTANLSLVDWSQLMLLGDDSEASQPLRRDGRRKTNKQRLNDYQRAARANRQLAIALRAQGINEEADHFAYRAQVLQRIVLRRQRKFLNYLGSWLLWFIAGYGYRPLRSILIYLCMIAGFAAGYFAVTHTLPTQTYPLAWYEALVLSVSSFHGRGFFQPVQSLGDPVAILASIEAVFGLLIEISFIATFTQRFFGR